MMQVANFNFQELDVNYVSQFLFTSFNQPIIKKEADQLLTTIDVRVDEQ